MPQDRDAVRYWRVAFKRLGEAELLLTKLALPVAATYLGGYAVECILKALILERTPRGQRAEAMRALKEDYGHNLRRLRVGVLERGAHPPRDVMRELLLVSTWSPEMRYDPKPGDVKTSARFMAAVKTVVAWADGRM
jgi:hypothetical protein